MLQVITLPYMVQVSWGSVCSMLMPPYCSLASPNSLCDCERCCVSWKCAVEDEVSESLVNALQVACSCLCLWCIQIQHRFKYSVPPLCSVKSHRRILLLPC